MLEDVFVVVPVGVFAEPFEYFLDFSFSYLDSLCAGCGCAAFSAFT